MTNYCRIYGSNPEYFFTISCCKLGNGRSVSCLLRLIGCVLLLGLTSLSLAQAAPGSVLFSDAFSRSNAATTALTDGVGNGWVVSSDPASANHDCTGNATAGYGCAGIDTDVTPWKSTTLSPLALRAHGSGTQSLFTRWANVSVEHAVNLAGKPAARLSFWLRRGSDCFSEMPGDPTSDPGCPKATATLTVNTGGTSTSVSGITVNGVQIMSGASSASATNTTVATNIAAKINIASSGYTATSSGNLVTITAPLSAVSFSPVWTIASGTMTFSTTAFVAVAQAPFDPLNTEQFQVLYLNNANTWIPLAQYPSEGTPGEEFTPSIDLPSDALWSGFKIRFTQPGGSGGNTSTGSATDTYGRSIVYGRDYWHIDDVVVTEQAASNYMGSFCDTFEGDLSRWIMSGFGSATIGSKYFQNGAHSLDIKWNAVSATTKPADITGVSGNIVFWVKRGVGTSASMKSPNLTGSDLPDAGENLVVEYLKTDGTWGYLVPATSFIGGSTSGQIYCPAVGTNCPAATPATNSVAIPADAKLSAFQMRFRLLAGSGYDMDYWHVDDLCVGSGIQNSNLSLAVTPANTNLAPGATTAMTATISNIAGAAAPDPITVTDILAQGLVFVSGSAGWNCSSTTTVVTCTQAPAASLAVGASTSLTLTFQGDPVAAGTFTNTVTVGSQSSNDPDISNNTATNTYTFIPALFEAYETNTTPATAVSGRIYTKLAGQPFSLKVLAKTASAINSTYNKTLTVDLIDASAACVAATTALPSVTVSPANHLYVPGDNGVYTYTFTSNTAYPQVLVRMKDDLNAVGCSSDMFAVRPQGFTVSSSNATANSAGTSTTATPIFKAGTPFNLTADTNTAGYGGTPGLDMTKMAAHSGAMAVGVLSGSFSAANASTGNGASSNNFAYSEVGYFRLNSDAVYDNTFTAVDNGVNDCVNGSSSNTADTSGKFGCNIGSAVSNYVGRFIPDHFALTPGTATPSCNTFTYFGEDGFSTAFTLTAQNLSNGTTTNYTGSFAKLGLLSWNNFAFSTSPTLPTGSTLAASATAPTGIWSNGVASVTAKHQISRPSSLTGETSVAINAKPVDSDGVTLSTITAVATATPLRYGRVFLQNAYGSELLDLAMPMIAQYWNGSSWIKNSSDTCTSNITLSLSNLKTTNALTTLYALDTGSPGNSGLGVAGTPAKQFHKPPIAGDFNLNWQATGAGKTGSLDVTATVPSYLQSAGNTNPKARATFGVYKGNNRQIYFRELY